MNRSLIAKSEPFVDRFHCLGAPGRHAHEEAEQQSANRSRQVKSDLLHLMDGRFEMTFHGRLSVGAGAGGRGQAHLSLVESSGTPSPL